MHPSHPFPHPIWADISWDSRLWQVRGVRHRAARRPAGRTGCVCPVGKLRLPLLLAHQFTEKPFVHWASSRASAGVLPWVGQHAWVLVQQHTACPLPPRDIMAGGGGGSHAWLPSESNGSHAKLSVNPSKNVFTPNRKHPVDLDISCGTVWKFLPIVLLLYCTG